MSLSEKLEAARVALGKRKERERELLLAAQAQAQPLPVPAKAEPWKPAPARPANAAAAAAAGGGNKLLAGHLAHEFLAHGTLLGRRIEPSRGATAPARAAEPDPKRRYAEVSWLLMASGAHVPGVVNPTQLGRWLQIKD